MADTPINLATILGKRIVAYKVILRSFSRNNIGGLALRLEDGSIIEMQVESEYDESWANITVTAPDDDQWVSMQGV